MKGNRRPRRSESLQAELLAAAERLGEVEIQVAGPRWRQALDHLDAAAPELRSLLERGLVAASTGPATAQVVSDEMQRHVAAIATACTVHAVTRGTFNDLDRVFASVLGHVSSMPAALAAEVALLHAEVKVCAGPLDEAARAVGLAEGLAGIDRRRMGRVAWLHGRMAMIERRYDAADRELRTALSLQKEAADSARLGATLENLVRALAGAGRTTEALEVALSLEREVVRGGLLEARLCASMALLHVDQLELDLAEGRLARAERLVPSPQPFDLACMMGSARWQMDMWQRAPHAASVIRRLLTRADETGALVYAAYLHYDLAFNALHDGDLEVAHAEAVTAATLARRADLQPVLAAGRLMEAACLALRGQCAEAIAALRAARAPTLDAHSIRFEQGLRALVHLGLTKWVSETAERAIHLQSATEHVERFRRSAVGDRPTESSMFVMLLARMLQPLAETHGLQVAADGALRVASDGSFFETPDSVRISLDSRPLLHRLLRALAASHAHSAGAGAPVPALLEAGWPLDRASEASLRLRLRVALSGLRSLGLGSAIEYRRRCYQLASHVVVVPVPSGAAGIPAVRQSTPSA